MTPKQRGEKFAQLLGCEPGRELQIADWLVREFSEAIAEEREACIRTVEECNENEEMWVEMGHYAQRSQQLDAGIKFIIAAIRARKE